MEAFATNRVYGLGLTAGEFWRSTPRELAAHARLADERRNFEQSMYAGLQATLHNAHFLREKGQAPFSPAMFMPDYRKASADSKPKWLRDRERMQATIMRKNLPVGPRGDNVVMLDDRMKRAREATQNGHDRATIDRILQGLA
jgi:hypothetical protein